MTTQDISQGWQNIIWREWRNCEDEEYARHLFNLVADGKIGWKNKAVITLLGVLFGFLMGLLIDLMLLPITYPLFVWIGGLVGGGGAFWLGQQISPRQWLASLTPNYPFRDFGWLHRLLILALIAGIFIIPNVLLMIGLIWGLIGGLVLGLVLGLLSWPLLGLISLKFFQGQMLTPADALIGWASVGVGIGIGVLLGTRPNLELEYEYRAVCFWWRERPLVNEVVLALQQACRVRPRRTITWEKLFSLLKGVETLQHSPETYVSAIQQAKWEKRFVARYALITLGGEVVELLRDIVINGIFPLRQTALWLLQSIERETTIRLTKQMARPLCARCLLRCKDYLISISPEISFIYHGCRGCRQTRDILDGEVVAILDTTTIHEERTQIDNQVRVNWLARRILFDFDRIEIIRASDEDVERFAVQIGNDTDPFRKPRYEQMYCLIGPECHLSENTLRILQHTFGEVLFGERSRCKEKVDEEEAQPSNASN